MKTTIGQSEDSAFETKKTPAPAINDAGSKASFKVIAGSPDPNGSSVEVLNDGRIPKGNDEPRSNFFFAPGSNGGRILVDLGKVIPVDNLATYSWHNGSRSAQTYDVYAADGTEKNFQPEVAAGTDPKKNGWTLISKVDTSKEDPGQHAVLIGSGTSLGNYRYVLFDVKKNNSPGSFNDTFFSEIDIVAADGPELERVKKPVRITRNFESKHGDFSYTLDASEAPDMLDWCTENLIPVMDEWYVKIIDMLPVKGISPSKQITFTLKDSTTLAGHLQGVPAYASGDSVVFNVGFMRREKSGEAVGAGVHEVVHVVQFAGRDAEGRITRGKRLPTWVTEGAADYIRWFLFEPESMGAEITKGNFTRANYDSSYRITANFFKYVIENYEEDLMRKINASIHEGYNEELWKEWTGKSLKELGAEWKEFHRKKLGI